MADNFAESGDFHVTFGFFLHAVILRHETDGFISPPKEGASLKVLQRKTLGKMSCRRKEPVMSIVVYTLL